MLALEMRDLGRRFGSRAVFSGLSGEIRDGEPLAITGPNGSGKSTLVMLLAGLLRPTSGSVRLVAEGAEVPPWEWRRWIGFVSPDLTLYPQLTALENLRFFARLRGLTAMPAEALLERVGLEGRGHDFVAGFSSGMRQRLKYAASLLHDPRVLFVDEPAANLDESGRRLVHDLLAERRDCGLLVIATNEPDDLRHATHRLDLAG
jgi:heme exporter protein A